MRYAVPTLETQVDRQLSFMAQKTMIKALLMAAVQSCPDQHVISANHIEIMMIMLDHTVDHIFDRII